MSDFFNEMTELERLATEYDSKFGIGKADEIIGSLMIAYSTAQQIEIFTKAKDREIIVVPDEEALDAVTVTYK